MKKPSTWKFPKMMWTDYPFVELGDEAGKSAPVRKIEVLAYDGDKYCAVRVLGIEAHVKAGYLYNTRNGR